MVTRLLIVHALCAVFMLSALAHQTPSLRYGRVATAAIGDAIVALLARAMRQGALARPRAVASWAPPLAVVLVFLPRGRVPA